MVHRRMQDTHQFIMQQELEHDKQEMQQGRTPGDVDARMKSVGRPPVWHDVLDSGQSPNVIIIYIIIMRQCRWIEEVTHQHHMAYSRKMMSMVPLSQSDEDEAQSIDIFFLLQRHHQGRPCVIRLPPMNKCTNVTLCHLKTAMAPATQSDGRGPAAGSPQLEEEAWRLQHRRTRI